VVEVANPGLVQEQPLERPRMDPPNVLWFAGTYAAAAATYGLLNAIPDSHRSLWIFLAAIGFVLAYCAVSHRLFLGGWVVPGGLAGTLAAAMTPAVAISFLRLIGVWSSDFALANFNGTAVAAAIATAGAGFVAYVLTGFTFNFALVVGAWILTAQLIAPAGDLGSLADRATAALLAGAVSITVGVLLDAFMRRREAFWFHVLGLLSVAAGIGAFAYDTSGDPNRGWIPALIVGVLLVIAAGPIRRATWAVYGVVGYYAALLHYLDKALNENRWPFALALLGLAFSLFALGMLQHRYGTRWNDRFVRRPPPSIGTIP
jgi:hypothetical protein